MPSQWKRFVVICADGSRETVYGTDYKTEYSPGVGQVIIVNGRGYRDERGRFPNAQGIHTEQLLANPQDYGLIPEEDADE